MIKDDIKENNKAYSTENAKWYYWKGLKHEVFNMSDYFGQRKKDTYPRTAASLCTPSHLTNALSFVFN
ncbi:hypothetical protein T09_11011 [Trichinella sp. T9]|nr:hypothetical protein T09_11011 [Trichinella sp. T9]